MSVKSKVKRCNKEIKKLNGKIVGLEFELERRNNNLKRISEDYEKDLEKIKLYENIIKFAITNHIGGIRGGMAIDWFGIDKMQGLRLDVEKNIIEHAYIMRVNYR